MPTFLKSCFFISIYLETREASNRLMMRRAAKLSTAVGSGFGPERTRTNHNDMSEPHLLWDFHFRFGGAAFNPAANLACNSGSFVGDADLLVDP